MVWKKKPQEIACLGGGAGVHRPSSGMMKALVLRLQSAFFNRPCFGHNVRLERIVRADGMFHLAQFDAEFRGRKMQTCCSPLCQPAMIALARMERRREITISPEFDFLMAGIHKE